MSLKDYFRAALGVAVGTVAYVPLVLIPLAGPMFAGFACGWTARAGAKRGFVLGIAAGCLGYLAWLNLLMPALGLDKDALYWIVWWAFLLWNCVGIVLCGSLSALASSATLAREYVSGLRRRADYAEKTYETLGATFIVCPGCGTANNDDSAFCCGCGSALQEENEN